MISWFAMRIRAVCRRKRKMKFVVELNCGDVYINGEFVSQLCFDSQSVGYAISAWLEEQEDMENE